MGEGAGVDLFEGLDHDFCVEAGEGEGLAALAHLLAEGLIGEEFGEVVFEAEAIEGSDGVAGLAVEETFAVAVDVVAEGWAAGELSLDDGSGEAFAVGRMQEDVEGAGEGGDLVGGDQAGEDEAVAEVEGGHFLFEL